MVNKVVYNASTQTTEMFLFWLYFVIHWLIGYTCLLPILRHSNQFLQNHNRGMKHCENRPVCGYDNGIADYKWIRMFAICTPLIYKRHWCDVQSRCVCCVLSIVNTFISARDLHANHFTWHQSNVALNVLDNYFNVHNMFAPFILTNYVFCITSKTVYWYIIMNL